MVKNATKRRQEVKKGNGNEATGTSQNENRTKRERAHLKVDMKNFDQPSVQESITSQGMTLRGKMIRAKQDNPGEGAYTELVNPTREIESREEKPPQPPPLPSRNVSPPPYPAPKAPSEITERKDLKTPPPPTFSNSTEMSTDDYNKVSGQLNKKRDKENKDETKDEISSTDSEVFFNFDRRSQGNKISQNKVQFKTPNPLTHPDTSRPPNSIQVKTGKEIPNMHESKTSDQKKSPPSPEPSGNDIATSTAREDEVLSSYMVPCFEQIGLNKGKVPYAIPNMTGN